MKTALYRVVRVDDPAAFGKAAATPPAYTFVCTVRQDGRVVDELRDRNIGTLMRLKARLHPTAVTVSSIFDPGTGQPRPAPRVMSFEQALEEAFA